jgi:uncharacterized protein YkwD
MWHRTRLARRSLMLAGFATMSPGLRGVVQADTRASQVFELTNLERAAAGVPPLLLSPELTQAAQDYAEVLAGGDCFGHACGPQADLRSRVERSGYTDWTRLGENIAAGQRSPVEVMAAWMASPGHRANILNPAFREIGLGVVNRGRFGLYWVQIFGVRNQLALAVRPALVQPSAQPGGPDDPPTPPVPAPQADQDLPDHAGTPAGQEGPPAESPPETVPAARHALL